MSAEPVSPEVAIQAGSAWLSRLQLPQSASRGAIRTVLLRELDDGLPGIYMVNSSAATVLVAGDMQAQPILGWTDQAMDSSTWPVDDMPEGMGGLLSNWGAQILATRLSPPDRSAAANPNREAWERLLGTAGRGAAAGDEDPVKELSPLLATRWGQGAGWNAHCPADTSGPGGHAFAGCVAVALAQILAFHKHPWRGRGIVSYDHPRYGFIDVDMLEETPAWKDMAAQGATDAAARLLFLAGAGVSMNYGPRSSSANTSNVVAALTSYFRYADTARMVWRASTPAEEWETLVQDERRALRPILHRGQGPQGGHAFVLDGWRSDGFKHLNFGWNGSYDGWFTLDDITPGSLSFTAVQGMVVGIQPRTEELIFPPDGEHDVNPGIVRLQWIRRENMARVELELSTDAQFGQGTRRVIIWSMSNRIHIGSLAPNRRHFWRLTWEDKAGIRRTTPTNSFVTGNQATTGAPGLKLTTANPEASK